MQIVYYERLLLCFFLPSNEEEMELANEQVHDRVEKGGEAFVRCYLHDRVERGVAVRLLIVVVVSC